MNTAAQVAKQASKTKPSARTRHLDRLRRFLVRSENRGRVVSVAEAARGLGISRQTFYEQIGNVVLAQTWFTANPDAPLDAKKHYQAMLERGIANLSPTNVVSLKDRATGKTRKLYIAEEKTVEKHQNISVLVSTTSPKKGKAKAMSISLGVSMKTNHVREEVIEVSEREALIARIRDAYVLAPMGDNPNVSKIMREMGLLNRDGEPAHAIGLTEEEVRKRMVDEDWREARTEHLYQTFDVIMDELKLTALVRNVEAQKILFNEIKIMQRNNAMYYQSGRVRSIDNTVDLDWRPDPVGMAGVAEVMRRMFDAGPQINVLVQNFSKEGKRPMSLMTRQYLSKITELTPAQLLEETRKLQTLVEELKGPKERITIEDIEAQDMKWPVT